MGETVEIADAYVVVHATMPGVEKDVAKSLGAADGEFEKAGKRGGSIFGGMIGASFIGNLGADAIQGAMSSITSYLGDSVQAYKEAEAAQVQLSDAYARFPAVTDVSLQSLRDLNSELMNKTRFDDDALASGQAVLSQYGLTGTQLQQLTPLLADYAAKTGKDAVSASQDLGKAMLGQGRALKGVGIDFQDAGSVAGNFQQVMEGLSSQVGGFAETDAVSAIGMSERMANQFGEVQESIGAALIPVLMDLSSFMLSSVIPVIQAVAGFFAENADIIPVLAIALGGLATAIGVVTAAMWIMSLTPVMLIIGAIVVGVGLLIAAIVMLVQNWDQVWATISNLTAEFFAWISSVVDGFVGWWNGIWAAVGAWLTDVWNNALTAVRALLTGYVSWVLGIIGGFVNWWTSTWSAVGSFFGDVWAAAVAVVRGIIQGYVGWVMSAVGGLVSWWNGAWSGVGDVIRNVFGGIGSFISGVFNGIVSTIRGVINNIIDLVNGAIRGINGVVSTVGGAIGMNVSVPELPRLADGGLIAARPGGVAAIIGEGRYDEVVVPLSPSVLGQLGGGKGTQITNHIKVVTDDPTLAARQVGREMERALANR